MTAAMPRRLLALRTVVAVVAHLAALSARLLAAFRPPFTALRPLLATLWPLLTAFRSLLATFGPGLTGVFARLTLVAPSPRLALLVALARLTGFALLAVALTRLTGFARLALFPLFAAAFARWTRLACLARLPFAVAFALRLRLALGAGLGGALRGRLLRHRGGRRLVVRTVEQRRADLRTLGAHVAQAFATFRAAGPLGALRTMAASTLALGSRRPWAPLGAG